jgi:hypothetical protein
MSNAKGLQRQLPLKVT